MTQISVREAPGLETGVPCFSWMVSMPHHHVNLVTLPWAAVTPPQLCCHIESTRSRSLSPHPGPNPRWAHSRVGLKVAIAYCFDQLFCDFNDFLLPYCWFKEKKKIKGENKPIVLVLQYRRGYLFLIRNRRPLETVLGKNRRATWERDVGKGSSPLERKDLQSQQNGKTLYFPKDQKA